MARRPSSRRPSSRRRYWRRHCILIKKLRLLISRDNLQRYFDSLGLVTRVIMLHRDDGSYTRCALVTTNTKRSAQLIRGQDHAIQFQSKIVRFRASRWPGMRSLLRSCRNGRFKLHLTGLPLPFHQLRNRHVNKMGRYLTTLLEDAFAKLEYTSIQLLKPEESVSDDSDADDSDDSDSDDSDSDDSDSDDSDAGSDAGGFSNEDIFRVQDDEIYTGDAEVRFKRKKDMIEALQIASEELHCDAKWEYKKRGLNVYISRPSA